jgi:hypothetical protein
MVFFSSERGFGKDIEIPAKEENIRRTQRRRQGERREL